VFTFASCSTEESSESGSVSVSDSDPSDISDNSSSDNCFAIIFEDLSGKKRPEVFAEMNIPSDEDIANCVCNNLPEMTDEELVKWVDNDDMDPINNEEDRVRIEVVIKCMGFDSFKDYMRKMSESTQK
jgi:hypothetical protein